MKYAYIGLIAALIAGGSYAGYTAWEKSQQPAVPQGYRLMPDGSFMRNDAMGLEGMGALDELRTEPTDTFEDDTLQEEVAAEVNQNAKVFTVRGVNFNFDVKEIRVKKGDTVVINFESTDGFHDWTLDEFGVQTKKVGPGTPASVTFVANKAGTFEYYCSVGNHRAMGMVGALIIEE